LFFEKDQEALALKKRDCVATLSEVNGSCVITFIEIAIFSLYFFYFAIENHKQTKKSKKKESSTDVPAQKRKKLHNEVRSLLTTQYFLYA
jgi:large-conductance mechanosensitive channel